jgi:hypothetical protein
MDKGQKSDLIAVAVIVLLGLFTAYVTFGILQSQASTEVQKYSLGGAIAGALVAMSMFFSAYRQIRKSSGEVEKLRDRIQELQQKVIRGAPCPPGFDTEVDERQRVVLAKPVNWEPRGGTIFDFQVPRTKENAADVFLARFLAMYGPVDPNTNADNFYQQAKQAFYVPGVESCVSEFINIGGEPNSIKSLKVIAELFARITISTNSVTGKEETFLNVIPKEEFETETAKGNLATTATGLPTDQNHHEQAQPASVAPAPSHERVEFKRVWQMQVICLNKDLKKVFIFNFFDDERDFTESSAQFNQVLASVRFLT